MKEKLKKISEYEWILPKTAREGMNVDGKVIANKILINGMEDETIGQLANVTMLPGVIEPVIALPDAHFGYGLPMGAVAAFDSDNGIISAGLVGFDINCLSGDTKILHEFGYIKSIKEFETSFHNDSLICFNPTTKVKKTDIALFMKKEVGDKKVYKLKTEYGNEIIATEDHPFFTKKGMTKLKDVRIGDETSYFAFDGIDYNIEEDFEIVKIEDIKRESSKKELIENGLLPLKVSNLKFPYLIKLMAFALGDGCAYRTKEGYGILNFYSKNAEDLEEIQRDLKKLDYSANIHSRERTHCIHTFYGDINFTAIENTLRITKQSLFDILEAMGLVLGDKVHNKFSIPEYLLKLPLWQKRLFLASFFGAELSSPKTVTNHGYNFNGLVLSLNKSGELLENIDSFLRQIKSLLSDFGVESSIIKTRKEYEGKKGVTYRARLQISSRPENLIKFFSKISYEYNKERRYLASVACAYLLTKKKVYDERINAINRANELKNKKRPVEIFDEVCSEYVNRRFLERTLYENRKDIRVAFNFLKFEDFLNEKTEGLGKTGQIWARIVEKEEVDFKDLVYDFTVFDENHNFVANNLIVSNCGVNLIRTNLTMEDVKDKLKELVPTLFRNIPCGVGSKGRLKLDKKELDEVLINGCKWALKKGYGVKEDLENTEENGCMEGGDASKVSELAKKRGLQQLGTLGAGNHFLEVQMVTDIYDEKTAKKWGITKKGQVMIMLHCGSRGLGHQVATDHLKIQERAADKYGIKLPDRQLACAPVKSQEGQDFFKAMKCAVNYSFTNRLVMTQWIRESFEQVLGKKWKEMDMHTVYGLCHNVMKLEEHVVNGKKKKLYVHRKGATRSFPGLPVLIAGSMGTCSYLMVGTEKALELSFGSSAHGAGRAMSRNMAIDTFRGEKIKEELEKDGKVVRATSYEVLAEEAPKAYKDVDEVVNTTHELGISLKVCRMVPLGVIKG